MQKNNVILEAYQRGFMSDQVLPEVKINNLLPKEVMERAVRGLTYIAHPLRLRILEFLDVNGMSSVCTIARGVGAEQMIVSQSLRKMREANLVRTHRRGIFIYYEICEEYPASIFICLRKLFGHMTDQLKFLRAGHKEILPTDYTTMAANRIKLFANYDKIRILEYLIYNGESCVSQIVEGTKIPQIKVSQYLKKLSDDDFVKSRREGRFVYYDITAGVHKTTIGCIHKRYDKVGNEF